MGTRPQTSRSHPSLRHHLRSVAALDLVRQRASFTPMDPSKDKWVESDKALATKLLAAVEDARKNTNLLVQARPVPVLSSGTGFSQYFQGPLLSLFPLRILLIGIFLRSFRPAFPDIYSSTSHVNAPLHIIIGRCCTLFNWHATSLPSPTAPSSRSNRRAYALFPCPPSSRVSKGPFR